MSNPVLFFIFIIVIDLILKSVRNKKKIEQNRAEKEQLPQNEYELSKQKPESIRGIMSTLRDEVERERQKEINRRQGKIEQNQVEQNQEVESIIKSNAMAQKAFEDEEYWNNKRKMAENKKISEKVELEKHNNINVKQDILKGIIFSEILSEPKSIKNQRKSM